MALHRSCAMAQCGHLLAADQRSASGPESADLFDGYPGPPAFDQDHRSQPNASWPVEAVISEHLVNPAPAFRCTILSQAMKKSYTDKQGQYLAFIYYYNKIHGCPPSEAEMQQYFRVSPPSVHQMILTLEVHGLIERTPGQARSLRLLIQREELPDLV
jgi:hypothetical protein